MTIPTVDIFLENESKEAVPELALFERWAVAAVSNHRSQVELSIRIVDEEESRELNHHYRGKDKSTNVLSFPADFPEGVDVPWLGDLAICAQVVTREASEQQKKEEAHWAHMTVHGILHLLGYDHIEDQEALAMEALETEILIKMGYPPPYETN